MRGLRAPLALAGSLVAAAVAAACYSGPSVGESPGPSGAAPTPADAGAVAATGLPCEVRDLLAKECVSCHGAKPSRGAKTSLVTIEDLRADYEGKQVGALSVERMRDKNEPMPPNGLLAEDAVAAFARWVEEGMPTATCGGAAPPPAEPGPLVCTSGKLWGDPTVKPPPKPKDPGDDDDDDDDDDDEEVDWDDSPLMNPGRKCVECHQQEDGPRLAFGGTVYPTLREPDECYGIDGTTTALRVVVKDAVNREHTAVVNATGNFYLESKRNPIVFPVTVKIVGPNGERTMKDPAKHGDCNLCHAQDAVDAPGRILAP